jgi:hypothetical protein
MKKQVRKVQVKYGSKKSRTFPISAHTDHHGDYHFEFEEPKARLLQIHCAKAGIQPDAVTLI